MFLFFSQFIERLSYFVASMHFTKENTEMRVHVNEKGDTEEVFRHMTKEKWHKMVANWKKTVTQNQYDNEIQDLRKIKETLGGKVSMKSLDIYWKHYEDPKTFVTT